MSRNFISGNFIKKLAAGVSVFTLCMTPVAQGAEAANRKALINRYLKETGLTTQKMTVRQYWKLIRHVYPEPLKQRMENWVAKFGDQMMPTISATTIKAHNGEEQVRLTLSRDGESVNLTLTGDDDVPLKVNAVEVSKKELLDFKNTDKLAQKLVDQDVNIAKSYALGAKVSNKPVKANSSSVVTKEKVKSQIGINVAGAVLSAEKLKKLSPQKLAKYLLQLRLTLESAQKVYPAMYPDQASIESTTKFEIVRRLIMGELACARGSGITGKECILAGYVTIYGENGSCGGQKKGASDFKARSQEAGSCSGSSQRPCNPLVYGYKIGGDPYCVSSKPGVGFKEATGDCNAASPIDDDLDKKLLILPIFKIVKKLRIKLTI